MDRSGEEYISEEAFLLSELRYTLGQVWTQIGDLSPEDRTNQVEGRTVDQILQQMNEYEVEFQQQYARIQAIPTPGERRENSVPEDRFATLRAQTIELLKAVGEPWSRELLHSVQRHVHEDRQHTTAIATCHIALRR